MNPVPIAVFASLLAVALIAPAAQGATKVRHVQVEVSARPQSTPPTPPGTLTLELAFKNKRGSRDKFTPRQLTVIDFSKVPLSCSNSSGEAASRLLLTTTLETRIKLKKAPPPVAAKPKAGRYAFNFTYSFPTFTGTIRGKIDRRTPDKHTARGELRSHGSLTIEDLDSGPGHTNCSTTGPIEWGGIPLANV